MPRIVIGAGLWWYKLKLNIMKNIKKYDIVDWARIAAVVTFIGCVLYVLIVNYL